MGHRNAASGMAQRVGFARKKRASKYCLMARVWFFLDDWRLSARAGKAPAASFSSQPHLRGLEKRRKAAMAPLVHLSAAAEQARARPCAGRTGRLAKTRRGEFFVIFRHPCFIWPNPTRASLWRVPKLL